MVERYSHLAKAGFIKCGGGEYILYSDYAALEAQLAEAKAALGKIAGSHWERVGYCQTDIDDVPDLTAEEAMLTARRILSTLLKSAHRVREGGKVDG